jgi:hypothetical protein
MVAVSYLVSLLNDVDLALRVGVLGSHVHVSVVVVLGVVVDLVAVPDGPAPTDHDRHQQTLEEG